MKYLGLALLATSLGCAAKSGAVAQSTATHTASGFPTKAAIAEVARTTVPLDNLPKYADVESWAFTGSFPETYAFGKYVDDHPWTKDLYELAEKTKGAMRPSVALHCVAEQLARFQLQHSGAPSPTLQRHIAARCRAPMTRFDYRFVHGDAPAAVADDAIWKKWAPDVRTMLQPRNEPMSTGLAFYRADDKAVFVFAVGRRKAQVTAVTREGSQFTVEGRLTQNAKSMRGLTTRGAFGTSECIDDLSVRLPQFKFTCPVEPTDDSAWIEMASFKPGSIFGKTVLTVRVHPAGAPPAQYTRAARGRDVTVDSTASLERELINQVNAVRAEAGHQPVAVESAQSRDAQQLVEPFLSSALGLVDESVAETVALGMRAGWNVSETVRYGKFGSVMSFGTPNLGMMMSEILDTPYSREVLLDPEVRRLSIGPFYSKEGQLFGAILATYALFETPNEKLRAQVHTKLQAIRAAAQRGAPERISGLDAAAARAEAAVASAEKTPSEGLQSLLNATSQKVKKATRGYVVEANDLSQIEWPPDFALMANMRVVVAVAHYQPNDEPWGRYVVMVVFEAAPDTTTASL